MPNLRCPRHDDRVPSMKVYSNGAFCFSGCGFIPLQDLGLKPGDFTQEEVYVEDVEETLSKVDNLPKKPYRGFSLPCDAYGAWLVWPDRSYYKYRRFTGLPKYRGPAGVTQPPLWVRQGTSETLLVVEGELDALSAALAMEELDVMSPGSSTNFNRKLLPSLNRYGNIIIIADDDGAGLDAVINLGALIHGEMPGVPYKRILKASGGKDFNEILVQSGREALRQEILRLLSKRM